MADTVVARVVGAVVAGVVAAADVGLASQDAAALTIQLRVLRLALRWPSTVLMLLMLTDAEAAVGFGGVVGVAAAADAAVKVAAGGACDGAR